MNTSVPISVRQNHYSSSIPFPTADNLTNDLVHPVVVFLLASVTASFLGGKHALQYGVFCASLTIWRFSIALTSTATLTVLAPAVSNLSHYLHTAITLEKATSYDTTNQEHKNATHHAVQQDHLDTDDTAHEKTPVNLPYFKLLFFPSRTTHRRLHPKPHAFNYSYLLVGIPVLRNSQNTNAMLSSHPNAPHQHSTPPPHSDLDPPTKPAWFSVHASDYLQRGPTYKHLTLRAKLDVYLKSQDIPNPEDSFPYVYLVTAPRFLGFSFNPVSFWYLYDDNQELKAMILEVNNTFDERRMYFLLRGGDDYQSYNMNDEMMNTKNDLIKQSTTRFTNKWKKDFHVSPFNDRDGTYSVNATDVLRTGRVDVTIVLSDDHDHIHKTTPTSSSDSPKTNTETPSTKSTPQPPRPTPKIIARVYTPNSHTPISTTTLSTSLPSRLIFLLIHGPIIFLTNPRILLEARKLWTKGLTVFYRPEPFGTTIPRVESDEEMVVEEMFREMLRGIARNSGEGIWYTAAAGVESGVEVYFEVPEQERVGVIDTETETNSKVKTHTNTETTTTMTARRRVQIQVLTPTFYTELAKSRDPLQAIFDNFGFNAPKNEKLVHCSDGEVLRGVLSGGLDLRSDADHWKSKSKSVSDSSGDGDGDGDGDIYRIHHLASTSKLKARAAVDRLELLFLQWLIYWLRRPAYQPPLSPSLSSPLSSLSPISIQSPLDHLTQQTSTPQQYTSYLRAVLAIILADRFALGSTGLLRVEMKLVRMAVILGVVWVGMRWMGLG